MPYIISSNQLKEIIAKEYSEIELTEVSVEDLKECVGFTYRWLSDANAKVKVTYLPSNQTVETGINADLQFLKKCMERNPSKYYWLDCICVPQDEKLSAKNRELSNMRTYYSQFNRVAFLGSLKGTSHDGHFETKRVRDLYVNLLVKVLTPTGKNLLKTLFNETGQTILNGYETRAWTFQEIAVAKEIEFMGLVGTVREFNNLVFSLSNSEAANTSLSNIFFTASRVGEGSIADFPFLLYFALQRRTALYARDMFYAILPAFDKSLSGMDPKEAWKSIRETYSTALYKHGDMGNYTIWIDSFWYGINNHKILETFAEPVKINACVKNNKLYANWKIADLKLHVIFDLLELEDYVIQHDENTWYFYSTFKYAHMKNGNIHKGNLEETNEWKTYTFIWKMKNVISVRVISASNLYAADRSGTSDPYVQVSTDKLTSYYKTEVIKKTLNPYWNTTYDLPVNKGDKIELIVKDENKIQDDVRIGSANIELDEKLKLENFKESVVTVPLKGKNAQGEIKVGLTIKLYDTENWMLVE